MKSLWIIVLLAAYTNAQYDNDPDYWQDYNEWYDDNLDLSKNFNDHVPDLDNIPNPPQESVENNDEIIKGDNNGAQPNEDLGKNIEEPEYDNDYQIEDNRSEAKESLNAVNEEPSLNVDDDLFKKILENNNDIDEAQQDFNAFQKLVDDKNNIDDIEEKILYVDDKSLMDINDILPEENKNNIDKPVVLPLLENNNDEEMSKISNEEDTNNFSSEDQLPEIQLNVQPDADEIVEDTRKLLAEIDNQFENDEPSKEKEIIEQPKDNIEEIVIPEEDNNEEISKPFKEDEVNEEKLSEIVKPSPNIDAIVDETRKLLAESDDQLEINEADNLESEIVAIPEDENNEEISKIINSLPNMDQIVDETHKILEDSDNQFDDNSLGNNKKDDGDVRNNSEDILIPEDDNNEEISKVSSEDGTNFSEDKLAENNDLQQNVDEDIEETRKILEESGSQFENEENKENVKNAEDVVGDAEMKKMIEETLKILEDNTNDDGDVNNNSEDILIPEDDNNEEISKVSHEDGTNFSENKLAEIDNPQQNVDEVIEETRKILEESSSQFENEENKENVKDSEDVVGDIEMKKMIEETLKILEDNNGQFDENGDINDKIYESERELDSKNLIEETNKLLEETVEQLNSKETVNEKDDNLDVIYKDLNVDLDNLLDTWKKLSNDDFVLEEENPDDSLNNDHILDYEEKYGRPYGEGKVLSQRDDYYESIDDDNLSEIFSDHKSGEESGNDETVQKLMDSVVENNEESIVDNGENNDAPILYVNDALIAADNDTESEPVKSEAVKTMNIEKLSNSELEQLTSQFMILHSEDIDTKSDSFNSNVAPIHIKLSVDEPTVVTSPNYPNPYPTNNVIDWIFDGDGVGIELNITDFNVNSALGDYLLVKPGSIDDSGDNGLIFAYHLNEERRYRFMDVDQLFMRFDSKPGMMFRRGFQLSVRMIAPPREEEEELPEPEPVVPAPNATMTLYLAGLNVTEFENIREDFRQLLASMATMYINANEIDPGTNATSFVTQITRTYVCNINWPGFENCVEVKFSIPLVYDDDKDHRLNENDLNAMWYTYVTRDPFATRLRTLGISEFSTPNDGTILMLWLILVAGVFIFMIMLAFTLWKYSCFENYTRMQSYSDTDSIHNEKRHLDMYPTPHQTLPPLFTESNYKWHDSNFEDTTRVDMGGFANRSYVRDEPSDESDEDVHVTRDSVRYTTDV
ncbi:uncharacterized protein ACR2FA_008786 isoform 2-T2 [Aphomia sociella]